MGGGGRLDKEGGEEIFFLRIYQKLSDTQFGIGGTSLVTAQRQLRVHTTPPPPFCPLSITPREFFSRE